MNAQIYYVLHVTSLLLLAGVTFQAFANPDPRRRKVTLALSGVLSLLVLTGGFGLLARVYNGEWSAWIVLKIVCWLWIAAIAGLAYRRPLLAKPLGLLTAVVFGAAVYLVYFKPTF